MPSSQSGFSLRNFCNFLASMKCRTGCSRHWHSRRLGGTPIFLSSISHQGRPSSPPAYATSELNPSGMSDLPCRNVKTMSARVAYTCSALHPANFGLVDGLTSSPRSVVLVAPVRTSRISHGVDAPPPHSPTAGLAISSACEVHSQAAPKVYSAACHAALVSEGAGAGSVPYLDRNRSRRHVACSWKPFGHSRVLVTFVPLLQR